MDSHVYGVLNIQDEELKKLKIIITNCHDLDIDVPEQICQRLKEMGLNEECFDDEEEIRVNLIAREYDSDVDCCDGLEVDVKDIPENVKMIRFTNTY